MPRPWPLRVLVLGILLLWSGARPAHAQFTRFQNLTDEQGLGNLGVEAIAQDPDGYIVLGTEAGLYRYGGGAIVPYDDGVLSSAYVLKIAVDGAGRVWVVTERGLFVRQGSTFGKVDTGPTPLQLKSPHLFALVDGGVVLDVDGTLLRAPVDARSVGRFSPLLDAATLAGHPALGDARFVVSAAHGALLVGCGVAICRVDAGRVTVMDEADGLSPDAWQVALETPDGTLWARSLDHVARRRPGEARFTVAKLPDGGAGTARVGIHASYVSRPGTLDLLDDRHGGILTQNTVGLIDWNGATWHAYVHHREGLPNNRIEAFMFDQEGSLWVGSLGRGAFRSIGLGDWEHWNEDDGLPSTTVWSISRLPNRQLWVATDDGTVTIEGAAANVGIETSYAAEATRDGRLWLAPVGVPLTRLDPVRGVVDRFPSLGVVSVIKLDRDDRLWLGTKTGLFTVADADAPAPWVHPVPVLPGDVQAVTMDPTGAVWVVSSGNVFRRDAAGRFVLAIAPALLGGGPVSLAFAPGGELWVGTMSGGVLRFRLDQGRVEPMPTLSAPTIGSNSVVFMWRDRRGWMWVGTDHGVDMWNGHDWRHFDSSNGLLTNDVDQYAIYEDDDGSMWFGTSHGLSHLVDPTRPPPPPTLHPFLTGLSLGDRTLPVSSSLDVDWVQAPLTIRFVDLDYTHGRDVSFRYRLRGLDTGWTATAGREIRYANLPAGEFRFELIAVDAVHGATSVPVGFTIRIRPPWWRRWWFYTASALAVASALVGAWQMRVRLLVRNQRRLESVVSARTAEIEQARVKLEHQAHEMRRQSGELEHQAYSLRRMAMSDGLTGLANRRAIMAMLEQAIATLPGPERPLAVLMCDIDHFKRINDSFGHLAGDEVLAGFGARLQAAIDGPEMAGRYGGEEFLVVLPHDPDLAVRRASAIRTAVTGPAYRFGDADRPVTLSGGLAVLRADDTALSLLARADAALYRAKENGRNRIEEDRSDSVAGLSEPRSPRRALGMAG